MIMPVKMYTYKYLTKNDKMSVIEDISKSIYSYISHLSKEKNLILSGDNSQRSIQGIEQSILILENNISVLNNKKQEIIQEE